MNRFQLLKNLNPSWRALRDNANVLVKRPVINNKINLFNSQCRMNHFAREKFTNASITQNYNWNKPPQITKITRRGFQTTPVPKALPAVILKGAVYVGRAGLMALPYAYRYNIFKKYPKTTAFLLVIPLTGAVLILLLATDKNPYTGRLRWLFQDVHTEVEESIIAKGDLLQSLPIRSEAITPELKADIECLVEALVWSTGESELREGLKEIKWHLVDLPDPQAFVIPDGTIFIYKGLLEFVDSWDQLAFVISHELSHYLSRHSTEAESFSTIVNSFNMFVLMAFQAVRTIVPFVTEISTVLALIMANRSLIKPYSRLQEAEADMMGLYLMARAGFDPAQVPAYWSKMVKLEEVGSQATTQNDLMVSLPFLAQLALVVEELTGSTHPDSETRKELTELQLALAQPVVEFVKQNPEHKWVPLYECDFWKARMQTVNLKDVDNDDTQSAGTLTHMKPLAN